jgi:hypothetical protein
MGDEMFTVSKVVRYGRHYPQADKHGDPEFTIQMLSTMRAQ